MVDALLDTKPTIIEAWFDGGFLGAGGPEAHPPRTMAGGAIIRLPDGEEIDLVKNIGNKAYSVDAEWAGAFVALEGIIKILTDVGKPIRVDEVVIYGDCSSVIDALNKRWATKSKNGDSEYVGRAIHAAKRLEILGNERKFAIRFQHIPRTQNKRADRVIRKPGALDLTRHLYIAVSGKKIWAHGTSIEQTKDIAKNEIVK